MTAVVITYIFGEPKIALGRFVPMWEAYLIGGVIGGAIFAVYMYFMIRGMLKPNYVDDVKTSEDHE